MEEMAKIICELAVELYKQFMLQTDNPEKFGSFSIVGESKEGYIYRITISREKTTEDDAL